MASSFGKKSKMATFTNFKKQSAISGGRTLNKGLNSKRSLAIKNHGGKRKRSAQA